LDPATCLWLDPLPLHHVSGLMPWLRARRLGGRLRWLAPALLRDPAALADACPLPADQPALLSLVPTQLRRLLEHRAGEDWLRGCRLIWVGGAALPEDLAECCRRLELPLSPCYGSSETGAMVTALAPQRFLAGESGCGTALPHAQLRIDPASGAVQVRAASLALGEHAAGRFQPLPQHEGWWSSGDLGRWGEAGGLELLGRGDGAIQSGGETVFPEQVERWRQASQDANEKPVLTLTEQKDLDRRHQQDQREIKQLKQELRRKEKALAEAAALLLAAKKIQAFWGEDADD
jgi:O-succinylbenzoic acid--CoA ligase